MTIQIEAKRSREDIFHLNRFIQEEEIHEVLKEMKNNKSPGEDGLSKEFYLEFKDLLLEEMGEMLNNILCKEEFPESLKNTIITLLFKKNDHRMLKNWRPVSLLNMDYKVLSKILSNRLRKVIHKILPVNQKCGAPNRKMEDVLLAVDSICQMSEE